MIQYVVSPHYKLSAPQTGVLSLMPMMFDDGMADIYTGIFVTQEHVG